MSNTDVAIDEKVVNRIINEILFIEKKNLRQPPSKQKQQPAMVKELQKHIMESVDKLGGECI